MLRRSFVFLAGALTAGAATAQSADKPAAAGFRELKWDELMPKGWDPYAGFKDRLPSVRGEGSVQELALMRELRQVLDTAPTNDALDGAAVKLPGYVVPLEEVDGQLKEFLLVPYFGACIHSPPPPSNQIVHVVVPKPVKGFRAMDTVWVSGRLKTARTDSAMGASGYRIEAAGVDRYEAPPRRE